MKVVEVMLVTNRGDRLEPHPYARSCPAEKASHVIPSPDFRQYEVANDAERRPRAHFCFVGTVVGNLVNLLRGLYEATSYRALTLSYGRLVARGTYARHRA